MLLVDDDNAALYALSEVLGDLGAQLCSRESGEDALRLVLKHQFAAILLDVRLPKMDGFEVAAAIRSLERTRRTPIIFMSANEDRRRQPRARGHTKTSTCASRSSRIWCAPTCSRCSRCRSGGLATPGRAGSN